MKYALDKGAHSVYALQYHFVQCIKYRKPALSETKVCDYLTMKVREISETFEVEVLNIECDIDHYHMIFKAKPTLDIPKYINAIKTITSREIKRNFPEIQKYIWGEAFWSKSYFLATTGQVTLDMLKKYVEGQKVKRAAHKKDQDIPNWRSGKSIVDTFRAVQVTL
jgi:putative transposase